MLSMQVFSKLTLMLGFLVFYFFFQAEDGIRDTSVTGVQTCALPISDPLRPDQALDAGRGDHDVRALHERLERHALPARGDEPRDGLRIAVGAEHADRKSVV